MDKRSYAVAESYLGDSLPGGNEGDQIIVSLTRDDDSKQRHSADQRPAHLRGRRMRVRLPRRGRTSRKGMRAGERACPSRQRTAEGPAS